MDKEKETPNHFPLHLPGTFTPAEGVEMDEEYVASVRTIVANKINFSRMVQSLNYYNYLTPYLPN